MGTTSLIVEMVIIGSQVLLWISFIVLIFFGHDWIDPAKLKDWTAPISLALIGASYTLGIVFDSFVGSLFASWEFRSWKWLIVRVERPGRVHARGIDTSGKHPGQMRAYIMAFNSHASEELTKRANRNSLIRATSLNLVLISVTSLIWVQTQFGFKPKVVLIIVVFSVLLIGLAIITWSRLLRTYYLRVTDVYEALTESERKGRD